MGRLGWLSTTLVGALTGAGCLLAPSAALAEIYGWVDPSGEVTYSNLPPPKNARVIDRIEETPPPTPQARAAAEAAHEAEMRALNERVRQLEQELQFARYESAPPAPAYPTVAPPAYAPPPPDYASYGSCFDSEFFDCGWAGYPIYYSVGVAPFRGFRHHHDHDRDDRFGHGFHRLPPGFGGPRSVGAPRFASTGSARIASAPHATAPHFSGAPGVRGSGHSSGRSGSTAHAR
jgi:Domain of unknown function (DUF4124)